MKGIKSRSFTLIEMLIVISIIALLAALLLPAAQGVLLSAKKNDARQIANALATAITEYETEYLVPPGIKNKLEIDKKDITIGKDNDEKAYDVLVQVLSKVDMPYPPAADSTVADESNAANLRNKQLLEVPDAFTEKGYVDPWGNRLIVLLDYDFDGGVKLNGETIEGSRAFAYSCGPDGKDDKGENDDICSWK